MFSDAELQVFLDELDEKIQVINDNLLVLERDPSDTGALQEIFRAAHTIKGSAGVMGYEHMASLTHEMENLFDRLRQGTMRLTTDMTDVLFNALDTLKLLRDEVTGEAGATDTAPVVARLRAILAGEGAGEAAPAPQGAGAPSPALTEVEEDVIRAAADRGVNAYHIRVLIDPQCQMKSVRAYLVFNNLERFGEIIRSDPPAEHLQDGLYGDGFEVVFLSGEAGDYVRNMLLTIAEVTDAQVTPLRPEEPANKAAAEQAPQEQRAAQTGTQGARTVKTVRVDVEKMDNLMNLVGELVIERTRLDRFAALLRAHEGVDDLVDTLGEIANHIGQVTGDLQDQIMKARMLPIAHVFNRFPRLVRDLTHRLGKEIDLVIEGRDTELDRNVIEVIGDPLVHLIRNAVDHGIEPPEERVRLGKPRTGCLRIKAFHQENHIVIIVEDDGRGMNPAVLRAKAVERGLVSPDAAARMPDRDALQLIFLPGFSTAGTVSDISGRGVGMDVVKSQVEQINGILEVASSPGQGTRFTIRLPLTLAIIRALMVMVGEQMYAFPLANVAETMLVRPEDIRQVKQTDVIVVRGSVVPLVHLADLFGLGSPGGEKLYVVLTGAVAGRVGIAVDELVGEQEIVIKSLGGFLGRIPGISGATILGDGRVALIVDLRALTEEITRRSQAEETVSLAG
ncbi:MAG: chemotaxis protein CheW [Desulfotomaculales bacterium]